MSAATITEVRELDRREGDGLEIRLLWNGVEGDDSRLWVETVDARGGVTFVTDVHAQESAMDVFRHPFSYSTRSVSS